MVLRVPSFKHKSLQLLSLCGYATAEKLPIPKVRPGKSRFLSARATRDGQAVFVRAGHSRFRSQHHLHVDVAQEKWFDEPPKTDAKIGDVLRIVEEVIGRELNVHLEGLFRVPTSGLPAIIRTTMVETRSDGIEIQMTGGKLSVTGAPVETISWSLDPHKNGARVTLEARTKVTVSESYLEDGVELIEGAFRALILGGEIDAASA